jgi:hypothetical protein
MLGHIFTKLSGRLVVPLFGAAMLAACGKAPVEQERLSSNTHATAIPVTLVEQDGQFAIHRGGEPYFVRGAGGTRDLPLLASIGGNSVRTWRAADAGEILDEAHELGLTVMLGIWLQHERHGFDYDDEAAVQAQKEAVRESILKYKDHPALLVWGLGNEVDLMYTNTRVWHAVEDIAKMVKELDPNHLVTTVTAGIDREKAQLIKERVPSIDYLSVNTYGDLNELPQILEESGWHGAYVVTEWGPTGHWEIQRTAWDVPIEQTSTEKAQAYRERYQAGILSNRDQALGSYAFFWGQKQETTPTWYGMFLESGRVTEVVDTMQYLWNGKWPEQRAPSIRTLHIDGKVAEDNVYLEPGETYVAKVDAFHPHNEPFDIRWEFLPESTDIGAGGDPESRPQSIPGLVVKADGSGGMTFMAPEQTGPYRLFVYVTNAHNKAATANIPFYVR